MLVSEILRIKGNTLFTTTPGGSVLDAVRAMADNDIGSLVVMDHGRLAGMLTFREVIAALAKGGGALGTLRVAEICERDPLTATPNLDVMELRGSMLDRHARYVPVMEGANCRASCPSTTSPRPCTRSRASRTGCSRTTSAIRPTSSFASENEGQTRIMETRVRLESL